MGERKEKEAKKEMVDDLQKELAPLRSIMRQENIDVKKILQMDSYFIERRRALTIVGEIQEQLFPSLMENDSSDLSDPANQKNDHVRIDSWAKRIELPPFLVNVIASSTSFRISDLIFDLKLGCTIFVERIIRACIAPAHLEEFNKWTVAASYKKIREKQELYIKSLLEHRKVIATIYHGEEKKNESRRSSGKSDAASLMKYMASALSFSEVRKCQLLAGIPFTYHLLMEGPHSSHRLSGFTIPIERLNEFRKMLACILTAVRNSRNFAIASFSDVKLPVGTSQGILLKSVNDGIWYRGFSKLLLAQLASLCKTRDHLYNSLERVGRAFTELGYYSPHADCFLGLRRMHHNESKAEPIVIAAGVVDGYTKHTQGRSRAIFPFSEAIKLWYKRYADGVKKVLFEAEGAFSTDPGIITRRLTSCFSRFDMITNDDVELYYHYDLSAYDTSVCKQLNDAYNEEMDTMLRSVGHDGAWGIGHSDASIVFCDSVLGFNDAFPSEIECFIDETKGWSTLSGQADVTLKNNLIHSALLLQYIVTTELGDISKLSEQKLVRIAHDFIHKDSFRVGSMSYYCGMHGDDVYIYSNKKQEWYNGLAAFFSSMGIKTGFEKGPVYLKKVPLGNELVGISGSLLKNRLGEYPSVNLYSAALSILDAFEIKDTAIDPSESKAKRVRLERERELLCLILVLLNRQDSALYLSNRDVGNNESISASRVRISQLLSQVVSQKDPRAIAIRKSLLAASYKSSNSLKYDEETGHVIIAGSSEDESTNLGSDGDADYDPERSLSNNGIAVAYSLNSVDNLFLGAEGGEFNIEEILACRDVDLLVEFCYTIQKDLLRSNGKSQSPASYWKLWRDVTRKSTLGHAPER